jgi:predicted transposase YdaD
MTAVYLDRRVLREMLVMVLHPRGRTRIGEWTEVVSPGGWSRLTLRWRTIELWSIPAEDLLASGELGVIPWVPLSYITGEPKPVLQECRARIDRQAAPAERENLLAVTQILGRLRYNARDLWEILGGVDTMLELPYLDEILEQKAEERAERKVAARLAERAKQKARADILLVLRARFGASVPEAISAELETIADDARLDGLIEWAARCTDIEAFRTKLAE